MSAAMTATRIIAQVVLIWALCSFSIGALWVLGSAYLEIKQKANKEGNHDLHE